MINENQKIINKVISNLDFERFLLMHLKNPVKNDCYKTERKIFDEIMNNPKIMNELKKNIIIKNNILGDLDFINSINVDKNSAEYVSLKNKIINVDEFENNIKKL